MNKIDLGLNLTLIGSLLFNIILSIITRDFTELLAWVLASLLFWRVYKLENKHNIFENE